MTTAADVLKMIKDKEVKFVDLRFTDTRGKEQHVSVPAKIFTQDKFDSGHAFDGSSIAGWKGIEASDMLLMPDPNTANIDPFYEEPTLLLGGHRIERAGHWFEPTVFSNVDHTMSLMREESFGPLIGIQKVKDDAEALALMNDTRYGLTAGMYTRDEARAAKLLRQVNAGSVYWNCCDRVSPRLPWSGHAFC